MKAWTAVLVLSGAIATATSAYHEFSNKLRLNVNSLPYFELEHRALDGFNPGIHRRSQPQHFSARRASSQQRSSSPGACHAATNSGSLEMTSPSTSSATSKSWSPGQETGRFRASGGDRPRARPTTTKSKQRVVAGPKRGSTIGRNLSAMDRNDESVKRQKATDSSAQSPGQMAREKSGVEKQPRTKHSGKTLPQAGVGRQQSASKMTALDRTPSPSRVSSASARENQVPLPSKVNVPTGWLSAVGSHEGGAVQESVSRASGDQTKSASTASGLLMNNPRLYLTEPHASLVDPQHIDRPQSEGVPSPKPAVSGSRPLPGSPKANGIRKGSPSKQLSTASESREQTSGGGAKSASTASGHLIDNPRAHLADVSTRLLTEKHLPPGS